MADSERNIKVILTADVSNYIANVEKARAATEALADELRACGISEADMPNAIKTAMRIVKDDDGDAQFAVAIP